MERSPEFRCLAATVFLSGATFAAAAPGPLYTPSSSFNVNDKIVSTTVFHWFGATNGQLSGPWRPLEGRAAWDGEVPFWKRQIKDIMDANISVMYVHLMADPAHEQRRVNLFQAAAELRSEGYNVPKIAPFLDPAVIWPSASPPTINLATQAGKTEFVNHYKRFYDQYFSVNTDAYADNYIAKINNKPVLNTWHILPEQLANRTSLTRADVESRMSDDAWTYHAPFESGVYMVGTGLNNTYPTWADERLVQFETHDYFRAVTHNGVRTAQVKAGYWDQNIPEIYRSPDSFIPRAGGSNYANAWNTANNATNQSLNLRRINVESWNEYDEGSGIFEGNPGPPYIDPANEDSNTDTWSNANNAREYIDRTAAGARAFNGIPDLNAQFLHETFPDKMYAGATHNVTVITRNEGDLQWTAAQNIKLGQQEFLPGETTFGAGRYLLDDTKDEIPKYGGIFRGRPKAFDINIVAPVASGNYTTHWSMLRENVAWFGEVLNVPIQVLPKLNGDADIDGDVDFDDIRTVAMSWRTPSGADWLVGDFDSDHDVDRADFNLLAANYPAGAPQARTFFESLLPHWRVNASGDWHTTSNWFGGASNGVDQTATFGNIITSDSLVYANSPVTLGTLTFSSPRTYLLTGAGSLTMQISQGSALVEVLAGTHKINLPLIIAGNTELDVAAGAALFISDPVTVKSGKTLMHSRAGAITYQSTITLESGASLDLHQSAMTAQSGDYSALEALVKQAFNRGDWLGDGITSTAAATDPQHATALGMLAKEDGVLVKYTYYGDANLDGAVNDDDFTQFQRGYYDRSDAWLAGDFDYSGTVDPADFALMVNGLIGQGRGMSGELFEAMSDFAAAEGLNVDLTAVPEPSSVVTMAVATASILRRRRRS